MITGSKLPLRASGTQILIEQCLVQGEAVVADTRSEHEKKTEQFIKKVVAAHDKMASMVRVNNRERKQRIEEYLVSDAYGNSDSSQSLLCFSLSETSPASMAGKRCLCGEGTALGGQEERGRGTSWPKVLLRSFAISA